MAPTESDRAWDPGRVSKTGLTGALKRGVQAGCRGLHLMLLRRRLPRRVALYFHEIDDRVAAALDALIPFFQQRDYLFVDANTFDADLDPNRRLAFLSFDDNYLSWHERRPLFARHRIPVAFYCNSLPLDRDPNDPVVVEYYRRIGGPSERRPLKSTHLKQLADDGHTIGCHSHSHCNLASLQPSALDEEIVINRQILQAAIGAPIADFSFPFGMPRHMPPPVEQAIRRAGFERIAHATAGMQFASPKRGTIHRAQWHPERSFESNIAEICVDGRWFVRLFGRSPVG